MMRKPTAKALRRASAALVAGVLVAGVAAPYWNLDRYRQQIQNVLETELQRRVRVGGVRLQLLRGPGVSLSDVVIEEEASMGREPVAYVTALEARVALSSLWTGKLDFASLRLVEPSVNLVKSSRGIWNFEAILRRTLTADPSRPARVPFIALRGGRINFKFGETKSTFYFTNANVDITPPTGRNSYWSFRFAGEPARTDRPARGLGRISGRGRLLAGPRAELSVELDRGYLEELSTLIAGSDLGLRGRLSARAQASGPLHALALSGRAELRDFRRWDLMPPLGGDWTVRYTGHLNLPGQLLSIQATPEAELPVKLEVRISDYLSQPRWSVLASFESLPMDRLSQTLQLFGLALPKQAQISGLASGEVSFSRSDGLRGTALVRNATFSVPGLPSFSCALAPVKLEAGQLRLGPWRLDSAKAALSFQAVTSLDGPGLSIALAGEKVPLMPGGLLPPWPGLPPVPLLEMCRAGTWTGSLRYSRGKRAGSWSGQIELRDAQIEIAGVALPLQISEAVMRLSPGLAQFHGMLAKVGRTALEGECRLVEGSSHPHQFRIALPELDLAELERLLTPTLDRRRGLIQRALPFRRMAVPAWLADRHAQGEFRIDSLRLGSTVLAGRVQGRLRWDGTRVELSNLTARVGEASFKGRLELDLRKLTPAYRASGALAPLLWNGGRWSVEASLQTAGPTDDLLANLHLEGAFLGTSVFLDEKEQLDTVAGRLVLEFAGGGPRLKLENLEATRDGQLCQGQCQPLAEGRYAIELNCPGRLIRLAATLWPLKLEHMPTR